MSWWSSFSSSFSSSTWWWYHQTFTIPKLDKLRHAENKLVQYALSQYSYTTTSDETHVLEQEQDQQLQQKVNLPYSNNSTATTSNSLSTSISALASTSTSLVVRKNNQNNDTVSMINVDIYDTIIKRSKVPLKNHTIDYSYPSSSSSASSLDDLQNNNNNNIINTDDHYIIHGIRIQQQQQKPLKTANTTVTKRSLWSWVWPLRRTITTTTNSTTTTTSENDIPLLFLHGYMNGGIYFYRNFIELSSYFPSIYAIDLLGWGLSSRPNLSKSNLLVQEDDDDSTSSSVITNNAVSSLSSSNIVDDDDDNVDKSNTSSSTSNIIPLNKKEKSSSSTIDEKKIQLVLAAENFFVESIEAWRIANNIDKFVLAGHSMGGYISVAYAERYPQNVHKLILISPGGMPDYTIVSSSTSTTTGTEEQQQQQKTLPKSSSLSKRIMISLFEQMHQNGYTPGTLFRYVPEGIIRQLYINQQVRIASDNDEHTTLGNYLYNNTSLPGSGENSLTLFFNEAMNAYTPLIHRINQLQISNVGFIYGQYDFNNPTSAIQVLVNQQQQQQQKQQSHQQQQQVLLESASKNKTSLPTTTTPTSNNSRITGPNIDVYIVSNCGHMLMVQNWQEFNKAFLQLTTSSTTIQSYDDDDDGTKQPIKISSLDELELVWKKKQKKDK